MRVWLVEDDHGLRSSLAAALSRLDGVFLTGCFGLPREALRAASDGQEFDVALVDLGLPQMPGQQLIAELLRLRADATVVALTVRADDASVFGALRAGAVGYLLKDASIAELASALELAARGGSPFSASIGRRVVSSFRPAPLPADFRLTRREREVLEELCSGASYREVASRLSIGQGTVQTYVKSIYEKLGVGSKAEAVRVVLEARHTPFDSGR